VAWLVPLSRTSSIAAGSEVTEAFIGAKVIESLSEEGLKAFAGSRGLAADQPFEFGEDQFKWLVRSANERTVEGLWNLCGQLLDRFTPTESQNYFRHCGYRYTDP